ncbi:MAG TPA: L-threonine 3-dehydrogenase [Clostridiales bacterium]|nr:L-threonine 3-dehydrogenase [Clostridiales bacterium]
MDALVKAQPGKGLELRRVPKPQIGIDDVLIKIHKTAICGTDLHIYNWDVWSQKHIKPPRVIGHEYVGEIAQIGSNVKGFQIGDVVSGEGHIICGHCRNCRAGNGQWCHNTQGVGVQRDGAFAEYLSIPASNCIPISKDIPEDIVSFFDAFGNATHTALMFDVIGEDVLITGAGPIGMMAAAICRHNGARHVIITDINDYRLNLAKKLGATKTVNVNHESLEEAMKEAGMVEGFDVALEMSGAPSALKQIFSTLRNGGKVALLGLFGDKQPELDMDEIILKGATIQGIYGRKMYETWYKMAAMVQSGLDLSPLITHYFSYQDYEQAFDTMNTGMSGKVILEWSK